MEIWLQKTSKLLSVSGSKVASLGLKVHKKPITRSCTTKGKKASAPTGRCLILDKRSSAAKSIIQWTFFSRAKTAPNPPDSSSISKERKNISSQPEATRISKSLPSVDSTPIKKCGRLE